MKAFFSIIFSLFLLFNTSFAENYKLPFDPTGFINSGGSLTGQLLSNLDNAMSAPLVSILALLYAVGDVIAVCVLVYFAIKILFSSPQQKAQLKASLYPYFIGLLLYIAGVPIAVFIINIIITIF